MTFRAFLDANVLVGARERDVLLTLGHAGLYAPLWSTGAIEEMLRHLPREMSELDRTALLTAMRTAFPEAHVNWPRTVSVSVEATINLKDQHIVASALWGNADVLVTNDSRLRNEIDATGLIDVQAPAEFVAYAIDVDLDAAGEALLEMTRGRWMSDQPNDPNFSDSDLFLRLAVWMEFRAGWSSAAHLIRKLGKADQ